MSRRDQIAMTAEEVSAFLEEQRTVVCATNGRIGWPHLMPLWYLVRDGEIWAWTYGKSQKVRNLERDERATLQIEAGEEYQELRGVMIEANTVIHRDLQVCTEFGVKLFERYTGNPLDSLASSAGAELTGGDGGGASVVDAVRAQAAKRVVLQFVPLRTATWDHRKLGGAY